jgi:hypothetical protein
MGKPTPAHAGGGLLLRFGASLAAAFGYSIFVVLRIYHPQAYEMLLRVTDAMPNPSRSVIWGQFCKPAHVGGVV